MVFSWAYYVPFVAKTNKRNERVAKMDEYRLEMYWNDIPTEKNKAATYSDLIMWWHTNEREARRILHELSSYDNGDNYVLIRSGKHKGFYKTDDRRDIEDFRRECLNKGRSVFAPVKKINRILNANITQFSIENNLRVVRERLELKQKAVCQRMQEHDKEFDAPMLSKMENGFCLPTPFQLVKLAEIYGCEPSELVRADLYY